MAQGARKWRKELNTTGYTFKSSLGDRLNGKSQTVERQRYYLKKDNGLLLRELWKEKQFKPNSKQEEAILYNGKAPLFITAAPGSGKTRVLLWRAVNLIICHDVKPEEIYLGTGKSVIYL